MCAFMLSNLIKVGHTGGLAGILLRKVDWFLSSPFPLFMSLSYYAPDSCIRCKILYASVPWHS